MSNWLRTADILTHMDVDPKTLRKLMAESDQAGIARIWRNVGSLRRPDYRWPQTHVVDAWWTEVDRWRASRSAAPSGSSAGATRTARSEPARAPTRPPPTPSAEKSRRRTLLDADGRPVKLPQRQR